MAAQERGSKRTVVMKTFYKHRLSSSLRAKLEAEVHHLRSLAGVPGVVQYINHFEDDECVYIVLERAPGPTLIELVANCGGRLPEAVLVVNVLIPLALLLMDLHRRGVVHRQVKPEHVLCATESGSVTLVDFSEAAPEVLDKPTAEEVFHQVLYNGMSEEELPQYDEKADVWSLGAVAFEALTGCQPFLADSAADMSTVQREMLTELDGAGVPRLFSGRALSLEARSFLTSVLQLDPINRPSAEKLLQHPLLQRYWAKYQAKQVTLLANADPTGHVPGEGQPPAPQARAAGLAATTGEVAAAAVAAAARVAAAACAGPTVPTGPKANILVAAPLQFPLFASASDAAVGVAPAPGPEPGDGEHKAGLWAGVGRRSLPAMLISSFLRRSDGGEPIAVAELPTVATPTAAAAAAEGRMVQLSASGSGTSRAAWPELT
ncbi:hypothetical protein GPECTOR_57g491 [Gonium pectorale]|uniref:Protein kinase domain-containing protein n=1 Tax=Gonium pectorale TaxID=33097 RepID=A0A150G5U3_GONPE|nr:hypothetical protein GPECTOR_57g491 [Gonium pectorale]|eukprot:KXZ45201.1 hypothetical protein GPECTOR_57g491 [Gonium pectorale]